MKKTFTENKCTNYRSEVGNVSFSKHGRRSILTLRSDLGSCDPVSPVPFVLTGPFCLARRVLVLCLGPSLRFVRG